MAKLNYGPNEAEVKQFITNLLHSDPLMFREIVLVPLARNRVVQNATYKAALRLCSPGGRYFEQYFIALGHARKAVDYLAYDLPQDMLQGKYEFLSAVMRALIAKPDLEEIDSQLYSFKEVLDGQTVRTQQ